MIDQWSPAFAGMGFFDFQPNPTATTQNIPPQALQAIQGLNQNTQVQPPSPYDVPDYGGSAQYGGADFSGYDIGPGGQFGFTPF